MRKLVLLVTLGLFISVTAANACDGVTAAKGKKAHASCMKKGKCTMTAAEMAKSGCCKSGSSASMADCASHTAAAAGGGCSAHASKASAAGACHDKSTAATGKHDCCKGKATTASKS